MSVHQDLHNFKYSICCVCNAVYDKETHEIVDINPNDCASHGYCQGCLDKVMAEIEEM